MTPDGKEPVTLILCETKHIAVDRRMQANEDAIKSLNAKVTATLAFAVMSLVSIVILLLRGV
jgi:hypothetical protein